MTKYYYSPMKALRIRAGSARYRFLQAGMIHDETGKVGVDSPEDQKAIEGSSYYGVDVWEVNKDGIPIGLDGMPENRNADEPIEVVMKDGSVRFVTKTQIADILAVADVPEVEVDSETVSALPTGRDLEQLLGKQGLTPYAAAKRTGISLTSIKAWIGREDAALSKLGNDLYEQLLREPVAA